MPPQRIKQAAYLLRLDDVVHFLFAGGQFGVEEGSIKYEKQAQLDVLLN